MLAQEILDQDIQDTSLNTGNYDDFMSRRLDGLVLEQTQQKERKMIVLCDFMSEFNLTSAEVVPLLSDFNIKL